MSTVFLSYDISMCCHNGDNLFFSPVLVVGELKIIGETSFYVCETTGVNLRNSLQVRLGSRRQIGPHSKAVSK